MQASSSKAAVTQQQSNGKAQRIFASIFYMGVFGASWGPLGGSLGSLGSYLGDLLGSLRGLLGASWGIFGASWGVLGGLLEPLGQSLEPLWDSLWNLWRHLGCLWGFLGAIWVPKKINTVPRASRKSKTTLPERIGFSSAFPCCFGAVFQCFESHAQVWVC